MEAKNFKEIIGNSIKNAIKSIGLKNEEVSKKLNITRQTLNNYINGSTLIDFEKLIQLSKIVNRDIDYFYSSNYEFSNYHFRSDTNIDNITKIKFEEKVRKYIEIEEINEIDNHPYLLEAILDKFDRKFIKDISLKMRNIWNISYDVPILNPIYVLEENGIRIIQSGAVNPETSGFSVFNDKYGYFIFLNTDSTIERQFFTCVHELAHFIFNKNDYQTDLKIENKKLKEDIANEFTGQFLIPTQALRKYLSEKNLMEIDFDEVIELKKYFHVSALCMTKRLWKEKLIDDSKYNRLRQRLEKEIGEKKEIDGLEKEKYPINFRFNNLIKCAFQKNRISLSKIAELEDITLIEARNIVKEWAIN
jgi:Zn-dependent peptidase ImmA (M78 family)/plasmid maintenance system antidote protein VapI